MQVPQPHATMAVSAIERGEFNISRDTIVKIAAGLDT